VHEIVELEHAGWSALAEPSGAAGPFYAEVLATRVAFVLPGMVITERAAVLDSMQGPPWEAYELDDERVLELGTDAAAVTYRARAVRDGSAYEALITSAYVREGGAWKLALHQQTPV
jgi:hypothetical protein